MKKTILGLCAIALAGLVAISTAAPAQASNYSLSASGPWRSNDGLLSGTWTANFDVAGYDLSGTLDLIGLPGVAEGNIAGSWDAGNIGFGVLFLDQELAAFTGGLVGDKFQGTFEAGDIEGIWTGALSSLRLRVGDVPPVLSDVPTLLIDRIEGQAGQLKTIVAKLHTMGTPIVEIENLLNFDSSVAQILALVDGKPNCKANDALDIASAVFDFLPAGCSGSSCKQVRALVKTLDPIVDGAQLFTCTARINKSTPNGIYQVVAQALRAVDIDDISLPIKTLAGEILVKKNSFFGLGDCHCRTIEEAGTLPLASIVAPLLLLAARRRRTRSSEFES
jgi:hypothetical protein